MTINKFCKQRLLFLFPAPTDVTHVLDAKYSVMDNRRMNRSGCSETQRAVDGTTRIRRQLTLVVS
jgi:hypothetical protein